MQQDRNLNLCFNPYRDDYLDVSLFNTKYTCELDNAFRYIKVYIIVTKAGRVVANGDNILIDFSHSALQKMLCSRTNCLCSRTLKFGHT